MEGHALIWINRKTGPGSGPTIVAHRAGANVLPAFSRD
jgi:hypothetical protein